MEVFKKHRSFFWGYFIFLLTVGYIVLRYNRVSIHRYLNGLYTPVSDVFFRFITYLGDGLFILILCLFFFFFISKRQGLYMGTSAALGGMLVQVLKQVVFSDYLRPVAYFQQQGLEPLRLVPDVSVNHYFSFPSGHTMVAFAVAFSMALFYKKRWVDQLAFILALLIGYSRVYLSQHFLIDVWMGSMIGILVALIAYPWYYPKSFKPGKFDAPLIRIR